MVKDPKILAFLKARQAAEENVEAIQIILSRCVDAGMPDLGSEYYNALVSLLEEIPECKTWDELDEIIAQAKVLEIDIDAWLSAHGQTTLSLPWPTRLSNY